ncbi:hypothetical protein NPIL_652101 [Nephila pilipes]|uniref:DUF4817 domain-containing protein n=1 Tax=Nephila pilipes TaxID=299642 RepID=A0A8X6R793_NEPPI|nr:hypothetical protein NPIL_652101 [Nephila pilipes]
MPSGKDKVLLMKLFYMNEESSTVAVSKFRLQKNVKTGKGPLTVAGLTKLVQRFEETGSLEDRVRSGQPSLRFKYHSSDYESSDITVESVLDAYLMDF